MKTSRNTHKNIWENRLFLRLSKHIHFFRGIIPEPSVFPRIRPTRISAIESSHHDVIFTIPRCSI